MDSATPNDSYCPVPLAAFRCPDTLHKHLFKVFFSSTLAINLDSVWLAVIARGI